MHTHIQRHASPSSLPHAETDWKRELSTANVLQLYLNRKNQVYVNWPVGLSFSDPGAQSHWVEVIGNASLKKTRIPINFPKRGVVAPSARGRCSLFFLGTTVCRTQLPGSREKPSSCSNYSKEDGRWSLWLEVWATMSGGQCGVYSLHVIPS